MSNQKPKGIKDVKITKKKRNDIAVDWDKVILEEVDEDD